MCDTASSTCVACMGTDVGACAGTTPVCTNETCQPCAQHSDCGTLGACLPTGACGTDQDTAWVTPNGSDTEPGTCTQEAPCKTITQALARGLPYVKVTGAITDTVSIATSGVTILADPGAMLDPVSIGPLVTITTTQPVEIDDLTIENAGGATGYGVYLPAGYSQNVKLLRVTLQGNPGAGVDALAGTITILRSIITGNNGGGITLQGAGFDIENCFIVGNGTASSNTGGISITMENGTPNVLQFDTIADNKMKSGLGGGVTCGALSPALTFDSLIVYGNETTTANEVFGDSCSYTFTLIGPTGTLAGTGNMSTTQPGFVTGGYHIQSTSPAKDHGDTASTLANDIDGDKRPFDAIRDIGADEYTQ